MLNTRPHFNNHSLFKVVYSQGVTQHFQGQLLVEQDVISLFDGFLNSEPSKS